LPPTRRTANRIREHILAEHGLTPRIGERGLKKGLPTSDIDSSLARLLQHYYSKPIREILELPYETIYSETGVNRATLWRWARILEMDDLHARITA